MKGEGSICSSGRFFFHLVDQVDVAVLPWLEDTPRQRSLAQLAMDGGDGPQALAVSLDQGEARGSLREGVARFLAIPYAATPSGDQRWVSFGVPN